MLDAGDSWTRVASTGPSVGDIALRGQARTDSPPPAAPAPTWRNAFLRAALYFGVTRAVILAILILAGTIFPSRLVSAGGNVQRIPISLPHLGEIASRSDGGWYLSIVRKGYDDERYNERSQHNWAF